MLGLWRGRRRFIELRDRQGSAREDCCRWGVMNFRNRDGRLSRSGSGCAGDRTIPGVVLARCWLATSSVLAIYVCGGARWGRRSFPWRSAIEYHHADSVVAWRGGIGSAAADGEDYCGGGHTFRGDAGVAGRASRSSRENRLRPRGCVRLRNVRGMARDGCGRSTGCWRRSARRIRSGSICSFTCADAAGRSCVSRLSGVRAGNGAALRDWMGGVEGGNSKL